MSTAIVRRPRVSSSVRWLQQSLNRALGLRLAVDGVMGPQTRSALRSFQQRRGLRVDGIVGPKTRRALSQASRITSRLGPVSSPTAPRTTPRVLKYSTTDVIDKRISVPAQHSLVRLSKNPATSAIAVGLLEAVKTGQLGGIFCVNWKKPAQRASRAGQSWWSVIPRGEDAVLMLDPANPLAGTPLIAFRRELDPRPTGCGALTTDHNVTPSPARLDLALHKVARSYHLFRQRHLLPCSRDHSTPIPNVVPPMFCLSTPREPRCSVPPGVLKTLRNRLLSEAQRELASSSRASSNQRATPKICLYLAGTEETPLFEHRARRWARRVRAIRVPLVTHEGTCANDTGATPYRTGHDIVRALFSAARCLQRPIEEVHIFGHMYWEGIPGYTDGFVGLYRDEVRANRVGGAMLIADIPTSGVLADNVVFLLHGCKAALTDSSWIGNPRGENFAHALFKHLGKDLPKAQVYGHYSSVRAGDDCYWRRYRYDSKGQESETFFRCGGRIPYYLGSDCCNTKPKKKRSSQREVHLGPLALDGETKYLGCTRCIFGRQLCHAPIVAENRCRYIGGDVYWCRC